MCIRDRPYLISNICNLNCFHQRDYTFFFNSIFGNFLIDLYWLINWWKLPPIGLIGNWLLASPLEYRTSPCWKDIPNNDANIWLNYCLILNLVYLLSLFSFCTWLDTVKIKANDMRRLCNFPPFTNCVAFYSTLSDLHLLDDESHPLTTCILLLKTHPEMLWFSY